MLLAGQQEGHLATKNPVSAVPKLLLWRALNRA